MLKFERGYRDKTIKLTYKGNILSYDLRIYTVKKQNFDDLRMNMNYLTCNEGFIFPMNQSQILVSREIEIDDEDIPAHINCQLPGIRYLIECNLEPFSCSKKKISELLKIAKQIAKNGHGFIENPQTDEIIFPSGIKRVMEYEKTERFSIVELSWWFNYDLLDNLEILQKLLHEIEKTIPEALPRRYGSYEPPKEKYTSIDEFVVFLKNSIDDSIVWYPSKPVIYVNLSIPKNVGPIYSGYRFGYFSIEIDAVVLSMPGWHTSINRLFRNASQILNPFYGDIRILNNFIRSRTGAWTDNDTENHPIVSWWWNGIPRRSGLGLVLGYPLTDYVKVKKDHITLNNGCYLFFNTDSIDDIYTGMKISEGIFQPKIYQPTLF